MISLRPMWKHQESAFERARDRNEYALFFEAGTGKTLTAINWIRWKCTKEKRLLRTLVLCPVVVKKNWKDELLSFSTIKKVTILEGTGRNRCKQFEKEAFENAFGALRDSKLGHVFIANYEALQIKDLFTLLKAWQPEIIIFDESHKCKSYKSKTMKLAAELADRATHKMLLTGTPILNNHMDIWAQYRILDRGETFGHNFFAFRAKYFYDKNAGMPSQKHFPNWVPHKGIEKAFSELIYRKASRAVKSECLDLPPLVKKRYEVPLSPEQDKMYQAMRKSFVAYLNDKACVATIALTKGLRLQQIASGFFMDDEGKTHVYDKNPRLDILKETVLELTEAGHKVIVWACFKENYTQIDKALPGKKAFIYGGMTDKERQGHIEAFQKDPEVQIMIANQQAGGIGINLIQASYMIYFSRTWSLEADIQSEARNYRGGSEIHEKITRIDLIAPNTIDELILESLERKENLANNILQLKGRI